MKKLLALIVSFGTLSSVFAQQGQRHAEYRNDNNVAYNNTQPGYGRNSNTVEYGKDNYDKNNHDYNDRQRNDDRYKNNHEYDNRGGNRNQQPVYVYDRNRHQQPVYQSNGKGKAFVGGAILGGILGVLIGSQL